MSVHKTIKNKIGLFFGSFNPIHVGHLIIANYFLEFTDITKIWFIVSPHNPLKDNTEILSEKERFQMTKMAIENNSDLEISDIEFYLPKPSYTIDTLKYLKNKFPNNNFVLIIGEDNLAVFDQWKSWQEIIDNFQIYVYNRIVPTLPAFSKNKNIIFFKAPLLGISSTFIRKALSEGKNMRYFVPGKVYEHIKQHQLYQ